MDDGIGNYRCYRKLLLTNPLLIFLTWSPGKIYLVQLEGHPTRAVFFQNSYFLAAIKDWNGLDTGIRKSDSISIFKKRILSFIRSLPNKLSTSHNPQGIKLLTRLRLGLSHLCCHKFKHNFFDTINPLCSCGSDIQTTLHFFLYCPKICEM